MSEWDKVKELLGKFDTAMLVTEAEDGRIRARPMAIADLDPGGDIWFITGQQSGKVLEIKEHSSVNVVCQDGRKLALSISGSASLLRDPGKVRSLWREPFGAWFPGGQDDPDICLIQVHPTEAEYWDSTGWKGVKYLLNATTAYAKGERPEVKDQHGTAARNA